MLWVPCHAVVAHLALSIAHQVAVVVLAEPEVGRFGEKDAAFYESEAAGHDEFVEINGAFIRATIGVGILEHHQPADRICFTGSCQVTHVTAILEHPDPPIGIELEEHRIRNHGLGRHQLDPISRCHLERRELFFRRERWGGWNHDILEDLLAALPVGPTVQCRRRTNGWTFCRDRSCARRRRGRGSLSREPVEHIARNSVDVVGAVPSTAVELDPEA